MIFLHRILPVVSGASLVLVLAVSCDGSVFIDPAPGAGGEEGGAGAGGGAGGGAGSIGVSSSGPGGAPGGCTPGDDATCNYYYPEITTVAGTCNADGKCTCFFGDVLGSDLCLDPNACTPSVDSCHGNDSAIGILGTCNPDGTCTCNPGFVLDDTGTCVSAVCHGGCPVEGQTRCAGIYLQKCIGPGNGCAHHWLTTDHCNGSLICNSDATHCVPPSGACAADADCACGCTCTNGACVCAGVVPPTCAADADCGPECAGLICKDGACEKASSHP